MPKRLNELSAVEAGDAIATGAATSEGLVTACLERISARDEYLRAWVVVDRDRVLAEARILDCLPRRSRLHGVPIGIKDVIDTADYPTACNSPIYEGHRPKADASCVALLKRAGCVILGKTVTTEFANIEPSQTRHPRNPDHTPGGSSSGSAAAVADFMVPTALGTQTAGSVIRPAAFCGDFAIKPSFGSINRAGIKFLAESLDTIGVLARAPDDLGAVLEILSGRTPATAHHNRPRIGLCRTSNWDEGDDDMRQNILDAAHDLEQAGAAIRDFELPPSVDLLAEQQTTVMDYETARALAWEHFTHPDKISPALSGRLAVGWSVTRSDYDAVREKAITGRRGLAEAMKDFDFLLTPSAAGAAPARTSTGNSIFNRGWTLLGNPCVAVPFGQTSSGLPLGFQLVGAMESDMALVGWARWVHERL